MKWIFFIIPLIQSFSVFTQNDIFEDLNGPELLDRLVSEYKPSFVLNYSEAREYMFENLQYSKDTIEGIYSGFKLYMPEGVSSRQWTFERGINTEHIYPRSKGSAEGNAFSDLHHLKPTRAEINSSRLNHPFQEIEDLKTKKWFRKGESTFEIPSERIDEYSELDSSVLSGGFVTGEFEPRESVKGDIARAVFYFFTMYNDEALDADPNYFDKMRDDLCEWHVADPADENEIKFTTLIADVQDGKENPFVLDCTLALRSYCSHMELSCNNAIVSTIEPIDPAFIQVFPNPTGGTLRLLTDDEVTRVEVINTYGQKIIEAQSFSKELNLSSLGNGLYNLVIYTDKRAYLSRIMKVN